MNFDFVEKNIAEVGIAADQGTMTQSVKEGDIGGSLVRVPAMDGRKRADTAKL